MTALRKVYAIQETAATTQATSLLDGDATAMFSSGSAPVAIGDVTTGERTEMFSSGS